MFTTTATATTSFSTTPVTATNAVSIGCAKRDEIEMKTGPHGNEFDNEFAVGDCAGRNSPNYSLSNSGRSCGSYGSGNDQLSSTPRSSHQDATTTTTTSPSSPTPDKRPKPHGRGLDIAKAASAGGGRGHQVTRPSPLRSMMTAT
ncbi:hypothetical protein SPBR_05393 [Sporothrix brasiliensis 5110]|uniref:Uncharacterized protein n=1 Tax=Sporothrix brasiliensis 5110 TaxID=1398154 RepID=A0A0C2EMA7_9PEZI|nr:uncharacterized protein SPBR_05393 [Sporothrix brasiliensis 5110]KIH87219.1 hypothetical protein SPBR_05393 [Sporothrix brasiliensis 5110]